MEDIKEEKLLKTIKPRFDFVYELGMPTGRKIKSSLFSLILFIIVTIALYLNNGFFAEYSYELTKSIDTLGAVKIICFVVIFITAIKLSIHITLQKKQYENVSYKFYETYMTYEDKFLSQHKKNILYSNVKEIEIRRTIWDRLTGYGVVVIYTNAENKRNNGIVVYALKEPDKYYEFIEGVINKYKKSEINKNVENVDKSNT